jgi:hypothetical protein
MRRSFLSIALLSFYSVYPTCSFNEIQNGPEIREEKIYVAPDEITLTAQGIYWGIGGEKVLIQSVQADTNGLFITPMNRDEVKYVRYTCPSCGRQYAWYENCNTPGCPRNPK